MFKNLRYIIFDVDGTIFDSKKLYRYLLSAIFQFLDTVGTKNKKDSLSAQLAGYPLYWYQVPFSFSEKPLLIKRMLDRAALEFLEITDLGQPKAYSGVKETLKTFYDNGITLLASTGSKTHKTCKRLETADIFNYFTLVIGSDMLPKIDHIPYFMECYDDFIDQAIYVGDTPVDVYLANKYGVQSIGIANTVKPEMLIKSGTDVVIENLKELLSLHLKSLH